MIGFSWGIVGLKRALDLNYQTAEWTDQNDETSEKTKTKEEQLQEEIDKIDQFLKDPTFSEKRKKLTAIKKDLEKRKGKTEDPKFTEKFDKERKKIGEIRLECKKAEIQNILKDTNMNWSSAEENLNQVQQDYEELTKKMEDKSKDNTKEKISGKDLNDQIDTIDLSLEKGIVLFLQERLEWLAKDPTKLEWNDGKRITNLLGKCEDIESKSIEDIQWLIKSLILFIQEKDSNFVTKHSRLEKYLQGGNDDTESPQLPSQNPDSSGGSSSTWTIDGQTGWTDTPKYPNGLEKYDGKWKLLFEDTYLTRIGDNHMQEEFKSKLITICEKNLWGINPNWLMLHMFHESGFNPKAKHSTSWALWLIQILPYYVEKYGTTVEQLENMSAVEQLDIIKEFYKDKASKIHSYEDIALLWFAPNRFDQKDNPDCILYMDVDSDHPYDIDHNGNITMGEFFAKKREYIQQYVPSDLQNQFIAPQSGNNTQQTWQ